MMLALTQAQGIILVVGGGIFVLIAGGVLVLRGRRAVARPDIPIAMRPGPSDADLETPLLNKLQGWGVLLVVFFVIWVPMTWLFEPDRNLSQEQALLTEAIDRGEADVRLFSEENQGGVGCARCHGPELQGSRIIDTTTGAVIPTPNLTTVCGGPWTGHAKIYSLKDIYATIEQGRGIMPSWSIRFAGALDDQQINDIVNYIVSIQDTTQVTPEHNVCVNPDATKAAVHEFLDDNLADKPSPTNPSL
jgi:cytochrome c553